MKNNLAYTVIALRELQREKQIVSRDNINSRIEDLVTQYTYDEIIIKLDNERRNT